MCESGRRFPTATEIIERLDDERRHERRIRCRNPRQNWRVRKFLARRPVYMEDNACVFKISNFPNMGYLNLEQNCNLLYRNMPTGRSSRRSKLDEVKDRLSLIVPNRDRPAEDFSRYYEKLHEGVKYAMDVEYEWNCLISLAQQWDVEKFQRVLGYRWSCYMQWRVWFIRGRIQTYANILNLHCTDSRFIARYFIRFFNQINERHDIDVVGVRLFCMDWVLSHRHRKFFLRHLRNTEYVEEVLRAPWYSTQEVVATGMGFRDLELTRLALELEDPPVLPSQLGTWTLPEDFVWPLENVESGVGAPRSKNSFDYYRVLTEIIVYCLLHTIVEFQPFDDEAIHLIWRAIPTPFLAPEYIVPQLHHLDIFRNLEPQLRSLVDKFFALGFSGEYAPRSLRHLSRCAVRARCRHAERVSRLPLPDPLKRYVNLEF